MYKKIKDLRYLITMLTEIAAEDSPFKEQAKKYLRKDPTTENIKLSFSLVNEYLESFDNA